jgi:hypothetical protein
VNICIEVIILEYTIKTTSHSHQIDKVQVNAQAV